MAVGQKDNTKKEETRWAGRMESGKKKLTEVTKAETVIAVTCLSFDFLILFLCFILPQLSLYRTEQHHRGI